MQKNQSNDDLGEVNPVKFDQISFPEKSEKLNINEQFLSGYSGLLHQYKLVKKEKLVVKNVKNVAACCRASVMLMLSILIYLWCNTHAKVGLGFHA